MTAAQSSSSSQDTSSNIDINGADYSHCTEHLADPKEDEGEAAGGGGGGRRETLSPTTADIIVIPGEKPKSVKRRVPNKNSKFNTFAQQGGGSGKSSEDRDRDYGDEASTFPPLAAAQRLGVAGLPERPAQEDHRAAQA
jgi:hypothetical protein